jgi:hypothetical protein
MLAQFNNMRLLPYITAKTILIYQKSNIVYTVLVSGGPGGFVELTDEETEKLLSTIDQKHRYGFIDGQVTETEVLNCSVWAEILAREVTDKQLCYKVPRL